MGAGKVLCIVGGILTLAATYFLTLALIFPNSQFFGIGLILNLPAIFTSGDVLTIIVAIVGILFLLSGIFIIIGLKSRAMAIIGSIFAILVSVYFMISIFMFTTLPIEVTQFIGLFYNAPLVDGIIPFHLGLGGSIVGEVGLGTYLVLGGGVLGLIGGIMGPDKF